MKLLKVRKRGTAAHDHPHNSLKPVFRFSLHKSFLHTCPSPPSCPPLAPSSYPPSQPFTSSLPSICSAPFFISTVFPYTRDSTPFKIPPQDLSLPFPSIHALPPLPPLAPPSLTSMTHLFPLSVLFLQCSGSFPPPFHPLPRPLPPLPPASTSLSQENLHYLAASWEPPD